MFATLRYTKDSFAVEQTHYQIPEGGSRPRHFACKQCRIKKLRCSGQPDGCEACKASKSRCVYVKKSYGEQLHRETSVEKGTGGLSQNIPVTELEIPEKSYQEIVNQRVPEIYSFNAATESGQQQNALYPMREEACSSATFLDQTLDQYDIGQNTFSGSLSRDSLDDMDTTSTTFDILQEDVFDCESLVNESCHNDLTSTVIQTHGRRSAGFSSPATRQQLTNTAEARNCGQLPSPVSPVDKNSGNGSAGHDIEKSAATNSTRSMSQSSPRVPIGASADTLRPAECACTCTTQALAVFEAITVQKTRLHNGTLDEILSFSKHVLGQCKPLIACSMCALSTSFNMLLIVVAQNLADLLNVLLDILREYALHSSSFAERDVISFRTSKTQVQGLASSFEKAWIGKYVLDSEGEWIRVMCTLTAIQTQTLSEFLQRLTVVAAKWKRSTHQEMLISLRTKIDHLRSTLEEIHKNL